MNSVSNSERRHIAFVGRRNVGKSSIVNAFIGQDLCIVSEVAGTTSDPVKKAMELLPHGPIVLVDTAGIDDDGELGEKSISKTIKAISSSDFAIVVLDAREQLSPKEWELFSYLSKISIPYVIAVNKIEYGVNQALLSEIKWLHATHFEVSCAENVGIDTLKRKVVRMLPNEIGPPLISDLVSQGDVVVLVVPIDLGAPKGRLILPQVQTIRESLDEDTIVIVAKDKELRSVLCNLKNPPDMVITDSQAIMRVAADVPENVKLTTFSILMARHKGDLQTYVKGIRAVDELKDGDKILIAEACSHHAQEDDIGRVKIPRWLRLHTKKDLQFDVNSGIEFPNNLTDYKLIIHCGGCMLTRRAMQMRIKESQIFDVPIVNYGVLISYMHGAIPRALLPFDEAVEEWEKK
ncbi:MAG: [FeFe] hydrogenase H-cluster maturation GTPase HydF [Ignavibacteriaceae bacterium]